MRLASGCYRIADNSRLTKHVVAAGVSVRDAGSTPAASTIFYGTFYIVLDKTGQRRDSPGMKRNLAEGKKEERKQPLEVVKVGNVSVPIYRQTNIIPQRDSAGKIVYGPPDAKGKRRALIKYQSDIYMLAYYAGSKRVRQKFSDLDKARREAELAAIKIGNGELEALRLKGHDRTDYVRAMQKLR